VAFEVLLDVCDLTGREVIDGEDVVAAAEQTVNQVRPDISGAARDEDLHRGST
jgi:hypothetical protein